MWLAITNTQCICPFSGKGLCKGLRSKLDSFCTQNSLVQNSCLVLNYLKEKQKITLSFNVSGCILEKTWRDPCFCHIIICDCSREWQVAFGKGSALWVQLVLVFDSHWLVIASLEDLVFDGAFKHWVKPAAQTFWKRYLFMVPKRCTKILYTVHPGISSFIQRRSDQPLDILLNEYSSGENYFPCYL